MIRILLILGPLLFAACRSCPTCPALPARPLTPAPVVTVAPALPCLLPALPEPPVLTVADKATLVEVDVYLTAVRLWAASAITCLGHR